jgi:hypothetical protein
MLSVGGVTFPLEPDPQMTMKFAPSVFIGGVVMVAPSAEPAAVWPTRTTCDAIGSAQRSKKTIASFFIQTPPVDN